MKQNDMFRTKKEYNMKLKGRYIGENWIDEEFLFNPKIYKRDGKVYATRRGYVPFEIHPESIHLVQDVLDAKENELAKNRKEFNKIIGTIQKASYSSYSKRFSTNGVRLYLKDESPLRKLGKSKDGNFTFQVKITGSNAHKWENSDRWVYFGEIVNIGG